MLADWLALSAGVELRRVGSPEGLAGRVGAPDDAGVTLLVDTDVSVAGAVRSALSTEVVIGVARVRVEHCLDVVTAHLNHLLTGVTWFE